MYLSHLFLLIHTLASGHSILSSFEDSSLEQNFAECVLNISNTYFDKRFSVLIQTPSTWYPEDHPNHKYGDKLIQMLHINNSFPHIVFGSTTFRQIRELYSRDIASYIVLFPTTAKDEDIEYIMSVFEPIFYQGPQFKAKLIFVSLTKQQTIEGTTLSTKAFLLKIALKAGIERAVYLTPENERNKSRSKSYNSIDVFSWSVNEQSDICSGHLDNIKYIDSWNTEEKKFLLNADLFPLRSEINLRGCEIKVILGHMPPYSYSIDDKKFGEIVILINDTVHQMNGKIRFVDFEDDNHISFPLVYSTERQRDAIESTYPHIAEEIKWFVPSGLEVPRWQSLIRTFSSGTWCLVLLTFAFGICTMWLLGKSPGHLNNTRVNSNSMLVISAMLSHLGVGVVERYKGFVATLFFTLWLYYCLIINTAYQSAFFGFLVNPGHFPTIKTFNELEISGLNMYRLFNLYLENESFWSSFNKYTVCPTFTECYVKVSNDRTHAVLDDTYSAKLLLRRFRDSNGHPKFVPIDETVGTMLTAIGINELQSVLSTAFDKNLNRFVVAGFMEKSRNDGVFSYNLEYKTANYHPIFALAVRHIRGSFYLLLIGLVLSFLVFLFENFNHFIHNGLFLYYIKHYLYIQKLV
ncbi:Ionotropic receptor 275 [Blattella germanica]|nr:Ionotropic receptor 275 [Blattella germanica]